jgi:hypothetical protein
MKAVALSIKEVITPIVEKLNAVEDQAKNIPSMVSEAVSKIEPIKGEPGEKGEPGQDGKSVSIDDLRAEIVKEVLLAVGVEVSKIEPIKGEPGEKGEPGQDGKSITIDEVIPVIVEAVSKIEPIKGDQGEKGEPGQDGRDAAHLEILPAIDLEKSYARGSYAKHGGGLWRSFEQTHGMRGWECIVEGVKAINVLFDGDRTFNVETETSSGSKSMTPVQLPVMIYKGVWREGEHKSGDCVTWGGSLWHCNEPTADKPGESKSWTLAVKRGDKGKPASAPVELRP